MNKNGAVFVITLIILSIAVMVCAGLATMMSRDVYTAKRLRMSTQAYFLAEAGIEESIQDLYDNEFDYDNFPKNKSLGSGSFTAVLNTSRYATERLVKITSTGTVGDVLRTISATVKDTRIQAFTYAALSGGKMWIGLNSEVNGDIHSNSDSQAGWPNSALIIGLGTTINGNYTACGKVINKFVYDPSASNQPSVSMPPFDATFWNYYYQKANVYNGAKIWTGNLNGYKSGDGIIWVNGNLTLIGNCSLTGCMIATGHIIILGTLTLNQYGDLPAILSKNKIEIYGIGNSTINGLMYANNKVLIAENPWRTITINGAITCGGRLDMFFADLNYVEPNPPGLTSPAPLEVICWGG